MSNRWDAMMVREYESQGQTKSAWTKIGSGFTNKDGSISVLLDAIPVGGKLILQVPMTQEEKDAKWPQQQRNQSYQGGSRGAQPPVGQGFQQPRTQLAPQQQRFAQPRPASAPPYESDGSVRAPWIVNGQEIYDPKDLPQDHPDFIPF